MSREYVRIDHTSQVQESPIESCMKEPGWGRGSPPRLAAALQQNFTPARMVQQPAQRPVCGRGGPPAGAKIKLS